MAVPAHTRLLASLLNGAERCGAAMPDRQVIDARGVLVTGIPARC